MKTCVYCASKNRIGLFFCEECGNPLYGKEDATLPAQADPSFDDRLSEAIWGPTTGHQTVMLHVAGAQEAIVLRRARRVVIGRISTDGLYKPDVDLTPYGALQKGVSRSHASVRRYKDKLMLVDHESVNGTFLNGKQLTPDEEYPLHDGDEIQMGQLVIHVYFK